METAIEQSNGNNQILQPSTQHFRWIGEQVTILAEAFGEIMTPQRLKIYAGDLADIGQAQLAEAFKRARRELRFFPKIAELRELAGAGQAETEDAEGRAAWDKALQFAKHYVCSAMEGDGIDIDRCTSRTCNNTNPHTMEYHLPARIRDAVRRCGGWRPIALDRTTPDPFLKKEFLAEYQAWKAVEHVNARNLLATSEAQSAFKQLMQGRRM